MKKILVSVIVLFALLGDACAQPTVHGSGNANIVWGQVAGTITDQADLMAAIAAGAGTGSFASLSGNATDNSSLSSTLNLRLSKASNLADLADSTAALSNLGATTVGRNFFTSPNPGAVRYARVNADNTVTWLDAASFLTAIGGGVGGGGTWGTIGGTLSAQTDLNTAFGLKANLSGGNTWSGVQLFPDGVIVTPNVLGAFVVNTAKGDNTKSFSTAPTFTLTSSTPPTGTRFPLTLTSTASTPLLVTITTTASVYSVNHGLVISNGTNATFWIGAGNTEDTYWEYDGTRFIVLGLPTPNQSSEFAQTAASTTDLWQFSLNQTVTGVTAITSFGTNAPAGTHVHLRFLAATPITYNATSMVIPGSASVTAAVGDTAEVVALGSGNWQVYRYTKRDGTALVGSGIGDVTAAIAFGTDARVIVADGTGKGVKSVPVTIDGSGNMNTGGNLQTTTQSYSATTAPGTPAAGLVYVYAKPDKLMYSKNDAGTETALSGGGGVDTTAIHKATSAEISALTNKATPVTGDHLLIEDSAASNAKKEVTLGTLPVSTAQQTAIDAKVVSAAYSSSFNGDTTHAPTKDAIYDQLHLGDTDDDGLADKLDLSTGGVVRTTSGGVISSVPLELVVALSDETTAITTGTAKVTIRAPRAMTIVAVRSNLNTASSSGLPTVDIKESGVTILSTLLSINASAKTSVGATTPVVISDTSIADDAEITFDITVAGTGAKGLKVTLFYY